MKILFALLLLMGYSAIAQNTYIHCGNLIDTRSGKVLKNKTIVVEGRKILSVNNGFINPKTVDDKLVDLKDKIVLSGLIDLHVHLEEESNPKKYIERITHNREDVALRATVFAKRTLLAGFTTVRDCGGIGVNIAVRKGINNGYVAGPRVYTAGRILASTGGHGDRSNGRNLELVEDWGPDKGIVNGIPDARKAVRQRYKNGADLIKITATGGVLSQAKNSSNPQLTLEEITEICKIAKDYGMKVAAHAHGDEGIRRSILGGVTTIEHGTLMSDESMELMKQYGTYYVPTITAGKEVAEKAKIAGFFPDVIVPKALAIGPKTQNTFARAYKKGVKIPFGTDAGVFDHGDNA